MPTALDAIPHLVSTFKQEVDPPVGNNTAITNNLSHQSTAGGLVPWVGDLFEQYQIESDNEKAAAFAGYAIELYGNGAEAEDVVDRALMLCQERDTDLEVVAQLLKSGYTIYEIYVCCEAADVLEGFSVDSKQDIILLLRFRRRFIDVQSAEDLAAYIRDTAIDLPSARTVPLKTCLGQLIETSEQLNTRDLRWMIEYIWAR